MTKAEREIWQNYSANVAQIHNLEEFLLSLRQPKNSQLDSLKAYDDIVSGVKKKIIALNASVGLMEKSIADINHKLDSPDFRKNILLVTHKILQDNSFAGKKLKQASDNLNLAVDELRNAIFDKTVSNEKKEIFKTREVYDIIRRQYRGLRKEYEKTLDLKFNLQQKIISQPRAVSMAKNIFLKGGLKALRANLLKYCKDEQRFKKNLSDFNYRQKNFLNRDWVAGERQLPESQEKIQDIATGILRKNFKFVRRLEETESRLKLLSHRIHHAKKQMDALKSQLAIDNRHTCYKVVSSNNSSSESLASIIADAILREPDAVQCVARFDGDYLEMEKSWQLMSVFDKAELVKKKILRDL